MSYKLHHTRKAQAPPCALALKGKVFFFLVRLSAAVYVQRDRQKAFVSQKITPRIRLICGDQSLQSFVLRIGYKLADLTVVGLMMDLQYM